MCMGSHVCWIATDVCTFRPVRRCHLPTGTTLNESSLPTLFFGFLYPSVPINWKQLETEVSRNQFLCFRLEIRNRFLNSRCEMHSRFLDTIREMHSRFLDVKFERRSSLLDIYCELRSRFLHKRSEIQKYSASSFSSILSQFCPVYILITCCSELICNVIPHICLTVRLSTNLIARMS
jgi:hypothetical protein